MLSRRRHEPSAGRTEAAVLDFAHCVGSSGWEARLDLKFRQLGGRSVLAERRHEGPLVIQKPLYPEGPEICHAILVHAPGGIAAGDQLCLDVQLADETQVLMTTPAATKWYRSDGRRARQSASFAVGENATLEWLPQGTIFFDRADAEAVTTVQLAASAVYAGWDIVSLGRHASGERFRSGRLRQRLKLFRRSRLLWNESLALAGDDPLMHSSVGFRGEPVFGSMIVAAGAVPQELLDACRALSARGGEGRVTALPQVFSARYLGRSTEAVFDYFERLRGVLRPWYAGRPALRARIWNT